MSRLRDRLRRVPVLGPVALRIKEAATRRTFPGTLAYWERRDRDGGTSGPGSYGPLAQFKADVLNDFVAGQQIGSVVEFGCGDGNQLSLASYPSYVGLDVSPTALRLCADRFSEDETKSFFHYEPTCFVDRHGVFQAELALSLDVLFHLVEDSIFEAHLRHLFGSATRHVIIYGRDRDQRATVGYVRDRRFTPWIEQHIPQWRLARRIPNRYPRTPGSEDGSDCEFFVYERRP